MIFDNPMFRWDDIGVYLLECVRDSSKTESLSDVDPDLLRDELLEMLIQEDIKRLHDRLGRAASPSDG